MANVLDEAGRELIELFNLYPYLTDHPQANTQRTCFNHFKREIASFPKGCGTTLNPPLSELRLLTSFNASVIQSLEIL